MKLLVFFNFGLSAVWIPLTFTHTDSTSMMIFWLWNFNAVSLQCRAVPGTDMSNNCWKKTREQRKKKKRKGAMEMGGGERRIGGTKEGRKEGRWEDEKKEKRWEGKRKEERETWEEWKPIHWLIYKMCH